MGAGMQNRKTIYDNKFWSAVFYGIGKSFLWLSGWSLGNKQPPLKKAMVIGGPHTSNWDFPLFMSFVAVSGLRVTYLGKHSLFEIPLLGRLFYYLGGIPVERGTSKASALVDEAVAQFNAAEDLYIGIAPEGTRKKVDHWKTGFYRIAVQAEVPILMAFLDAHTKQISIHDAPFYPTGDMEKDIADMQAFYASKKPINPENA